MKEKIVVIGGGLAGCILCNELAESFDVALLEKGGENSISYPALNFPRKKLAEVHTCCYGGGGTTNLWHNGLIPIGTEDVNDPEFRDVLQEAEAYMDKAAAAMFFTGGSFSHEHRQLRQQANEPFTGIFRHGIDCLVYPKKFEKMKVSPSVGAFYSVEDIDFVLRDGHIVEVHFTQDGRKTSLPCDRVIFAAGTLGTAPLLQKVVKARQAATIDQAGLGFIDHPMGFVGKVKFKKDVAPSINRLCSWDRGRYISRNAVRLKSPCGRYTACAFFRTALTMDNRLSLYKFKSSIGASSGMARLKNMVSWRLLHPDILAEIFAHVAGFTLPSRIYNILFIAEQTRGGNRVYEQDGRIHVDWGISNEELTVYRQMLAELRKMLHPLADEININSEIGEEWLWSAAHHSGTISLGSAPGKLVDRNLKLKCCGNVYICDGSILQQHSYANTGLAIGQLALRLADRISHG